MIKAATRRKDAANPAYLSHFHLRQAPFAPGADPAFFHPDPVRERYLNMLLHLTQYSEELLLVTGENGMGKSALLEKFVSRADDHWQVCRIAGGASAQPDALFVHIANCFKLDLTRVPPDRLLDALKEHLSRLQQQMTPVLTIDDAHLLSEDALEIALRLAELQGEHGRLVRVVLFAEPSLLSRLGTERFKGIPEPHRLDLEALDEEQTGAYLNHRLRAAGYGGTTPFTPRHIKRIHKESRGVPAAINRVAHQVLDELSGGRGPGFRLAVPAAVWKTAAGGIVLGLLLVAARDELAALLGGNPPPAVPHAGREEPGGGPILRPAERSMQSGLAMVLRQGERLLISCGSAVAAEPVPGERPPAQPIRPSGQQPGPSEPPSRPDEERPRPLSRPLMQPLPEPEPAPPREAQAAAPEPDEAPAADPTPAPEPPAAVPPPAIPEAAPEAAPTTIEPPPQAAAPQPPLLGTIEPSPVTGSREPQTVTLHGENLLPVGSVALSWSDGAKVLDPSQVKAIAPDRLQLNLTTGVKADTWAVQVTAPDGARSNVLRFTVVPPAAPPSKPAEPAPVDAPTPAGPPADGLLGAAWVRSRQPGHFTIQLLAAAYRETLTTFTRRQPLPPPAAAVEVMRGDGRYHLLLVGDYASREMADRALAGLPKAIRDSRPWVRTFAGIQAELAPETAVPPASPAAAPSAAVEPRDAAWLWSQPPTHYSVQLASVGERAALTPLLGSVPAEVPVAIASLSRGGRRSHTLLYGSYPTKEAATAAIAGLPAPLRAGSPWARPFAEIQDGLSQDRP